MKRLRPARWRIAVAGIALAAVGAGVATGALGDALVTSSPGVAGPSPKSQDPEGSSDVSLQSGGFTYSYPIVVPPGRLGVQPQVALGYSSQGSLRGGLAAGWSLSIPMIRRDWSSGVVGAANWLSTMAGGARLVATPEPEWPAGQGYRAQDDSSFTRYRQTPLGGSDGQ